MMADDRLDEQAGQRRGDPQRGQIVEAGAKRLEDARHVRVLQREADLDAEEAERNVPQPGQATAGVFLLPRIVTLPLPGHVARLRKLAEQSAVGQRRPDAFVCSGQLDSRTTSLTGRSRLSRMPAPRSCDSGFDQCFAGAACPARRCSAAGSDRLRGGNVVEADDRDFVRDRASRASAARASRR